MSVRTPRKTKHLATTADDLSPADLTPEDLTPADLTPDHVKIEPVAIEDDATYEAAPEDPAPALAALRESAQSVQLATIDASGEPHCGYTPFAFDTRIPGEGAGEKAGAGALVIFVSRLALHTRDLIETRRCGAMLIADESASAQIFARTRVSYQCDVDRVERDRIVDGVTERERLLNVLQQRHGRMIGLLRRLGDFELFRLVPTSGQFVMGFGKAYRLRGDALDRFEHATTA